MKLPFQKLRQVGAACTGRAPPGVSVDTGNAIPDWALRTGNARCAFGKQSVKRFMRRSTWYASRQWPATIACALQKWRRYTCIPISRILNTWLVLIASAIVGMTGAYAATNSATGGIGATNNGTFTGGDGSGTAQIEINSVRLALVKQATDLAGTVFAPNADVASGQEIYFVLYIDNTTDFSAYRLTIEDAIDETQFTYVADSLESTAVASGSDAATRWAGLWIPLTDVLGAPDDEASILDTGGPVAADRLTVGDVAGQANAFLDIPARTQWAIRFRVRVN